MSKKKGMSIEEYMRTIRWVFNLLLRRKTLYILASLAAALEMVISLIIPSLYQEITKMVESGIGRNLVVEVALKFAGLFLLTPLICWGNYIQHKCAYIAQGRLRSRVFDHVQHQSIPALSDQRLGEYVTLMTSDVDRAAGLLQNHAFQELFRFIVLFVGALVLLLSNIWVTLITLSFGILSFFCAVKMNPMVRNLGREAQEYAGSSASFLLDLMRGMPLVRVFHMYERLKAQYRVICLGILERRVKYRTFVGIIDGLVGICQYATQPLTFVFCLIWVLEGRMLVSEAVYLSSLAGVMAEAFRALNSFIAHAQSSMVSSKRVMTFMDQPLEDMGKDKYPDLSYGLAIEWRNVHFAYEPGQPVLNGLSMQVPRGSMVALIGGSGEGKTTILQLLQHFYVPDCGQIIFFGEDMRDLSVKVVRQLIAYVPQDCTLFDGSISENIDFGKPGSSQVAIEEAARRANIHETILQLPLGYNTNIGERGLQLSGGQRQRITIARAFLKDAPILLLDEITASLDSESEAEVMQAIHALMHGRTTIIVAHRLSTIRQADIVYTVERGSAVLQEKIDKKIE